MSITTRVMPAELVHELREAFRAFQSHAEPQPVKGEDPDDAPQPCLRCAEALKSIRTQSDSRQHREAWKQMACSEGRGLIEAWNLVSDTMTEVYRSGGAPRC